MHGLIAVPATESTLLLFVAQLHVNGVKASSVKVYLSAIRSLHIESGFDDPTSHAERVKMAIRSIERQQPPPVQKLPMTLTILQKLHQVMDQNTYNTLMIWSAMCLAHFGCLRTGEFTSRTQNIDQLYLLRNDLTIDDCLTLHLRTSKTDIRNLGINIVIGCTKQPVCAYCAIVKYCNYRDNNHSLEAPLFLFNNGAILTRETFIKHTRLHLTLIGIDPARYSGHSYRTGGATTAALAGLHDWEIKQLGRWKSDTYHRYIRTNNTHELGSNTLAYRMSNNTT
jgi:hypothetical protein